jgi:hypothetical protein
MVRLEPAEFNGNDEMRIATALLPAKQLLTSNTRTLSVKQARKMKEMGSVRMVAVKNEVTRHGTKITHRGYELYFLESVSAFWREVIEQYSPKWIEAMLEEYCQQLTARRSGVSRQRGRYWD